VVRPTPPWPRRIGWPEDLAAFLAERATRDFEWGVHDCVTLAADAALLITGRDPIAAYRGRYSCEASGEALVGPAGLLPFLRQLMALHGAPECPVALAQRGDWAMVTVGNLLVTGIVLGPTVIAPGAQRLVQVPLRRAVIAWAI
jgi:hypothetical protein